MLNEKKIEWKFNYLNYFRNKSKQFNKYIIFCLTITFRINIVKINN